MAYLNDKPVWEEGVRKLELTDDCEAGVFNGPNEQLARRTKYLKQAVEAGETARQEGMAETASRLNAVEGRGGPVAAHDFATETPAQEALTRYACEAVWARAGHSCGTAAIPPPLPARPAGLFTRRRRYLTAHRFATRITVQTTVLF